MEKRGKKGGKKSKKFKNRGKSNPQESTKNDPNSEFGYIEHRKGLTLIICHVKPNSKETRITVKPKSQIFDFLTF